MKAEGAAFPLRKTKGRAAVCLFLLEAKGGSPDRPPFLCKGIRGGAPDRLCCLLKLKRGAAFPFPSKERETGRLPFSFRGEREGSPFLSLKLKRRGRLAIPFKEKGTRADFLSLEREARLPFCLNWKQRGALPLPSKEEGHGPTSFPLKGRDAYPSVKMRNKGVPCRSLQRKRDTGRLPFP